MMIGRKGKEVIVTFENEKKDGKLLTLETVDQETHLSLQLIPIPHKFTSVRCGKWHSLALTEDGKVWTWGKNISAEVCVPFSCYTLPPRQLPELDPYRVVAVECGGQHSLALTDQGEVYGWGDNFWGQLSETSAYSTLPPTQIPTPSPIKSMAAGNEHTLLLTQTGEVYACGDNGCGQLGFQTTYRRNRSLSKVEGLPSISQIASHSHTNLSIAMYSNQQCFVWGELDDRTFIATPQKFPSEVYSTGKSPFAFYSFHRSTPLSVPETPPNRLSARLSRMFNNPETSDVQFVVEQRTIYAHRNILSNSSDYFARMFSKRWLVPVDPEDPIVKVTIPNHSYEIFHAFLRYFYTDCIEIHSELLPELFELSNQYLESELQYLCLSRLRTTITPATCCIYYPLTERHSLPVLDFFQQELIQFASSRMSEVVDSASYQSMDPELCKKFTLSMIAYSPNHPNHNDN